MSGQATAVAAPPPAPVEEPAPKTSQWRENALLTFLSMVLALGIGGILIIAADPDVQAASKYLFSQPSDFFREAWISVSTAYVALFQGSVVDISAYTVADALRPLTETLTFAAPLIAAGLAVALAFKAGLFNIGAEGQIILGATVAGYIGFAFDLPVGIHLLVAILGGALAGALWGGIAGGLKARTGAHEVITTIMLNYIAVYLLAYLLTTDAFQRPGRNDPISPIIDDSAAYPLLLGSSYRLHAGLLVALGAAGFTWWLLNRSTIGFRYRAVGANSAASRTAGMNVDRSLMTVMMVAGCFAGLAGTMQILGTERALTGGISAGIGFDAITVALLGRGSPVGVVLAGILFGGLNAGGIAMQAQTGTPIDIVLVVQSLIVLFIAAPPLVRQIFRLKSAGTIGSMQMSKGWNG